MGALNNAIIFDTAGHIEHRYILCWDGISEDLRGSWRDGPVSASRAGHAAASAGSTVAQPSRTAANQPVAHEMGDRGVRYRERQQRDCDQVKTEAGIQNPRQGNRAHM